MKDFSALVGTVVLVVVGGLIAVVTTIRDQRGGALNTTSPSPPAWSSTTFSPSSTAAHIQEQEQRANEARAMINPIVNSTWSTTERQLCLNQVGFDLAVDGVSGPQTESAAAALQMRAGDGGLSDTDFVRCISAIATYRSLTSAAGNPAHGLSPSPSQATVPVPLYGTDPDYGLRTEHVSGYTRRNGTYVAPYVRRPGH